MVRVVAPVETGLDLESLFVEAAAAVAVGSVLGVRVLDRKSVLHDAHVGR
jgi:hypothetical protein